MSSFHKAEEFLSSPGINFHTHPQLWSLTIFWPLYLCVLMSRGCIGLPNSYAWGDFGALALGVWAIAQRDSLDAVIMVSHRINFLHITTNNIM